MNINSTYAGAQSYFATTQTNAKSTPAKQESTVNSAQIANEQESHTQNTKILGSLNGSDEHIADLEKAIANTDIDSLKEAAKKLNKSVLEVNWDRVVDPDGQIYTLAHIESIVSQYEDAKSQIEEYYAPAHKDNLSKGSEVASMNYLAQKYTKFGLETGSPYYRHDMSEAERQMAFRQERALLLGGRVILADPYALGGNLLNIDKVDKIAKQAAQDKINALIDEYKKANGISEASKNESVDLLA